MRTSKFLTESIDARIYGLLRLGFASLALAAADTGGMVVSPAPETKVFWILSNVFGLLAICGVFSRISIFATGVSLLGYYVNWKFSTPGPLLLTTNSVVFIALACLIVSASECGRFLAFDLIFEKPHPSDLVAGWPLSLFRLFTSWVYLWAAIHKMKAGYVSGFVLEQTLIFDIFGSYQTLPSFISASLPLVAVLSIIVELFIAAALQFPRARPAAMILGLMFHVAATIVYPVALFTLVMFMAYLAFVPDKWIDAITRRGKISA